MLDWTKARLQLEKTPLQPVYTCVGTESVLTDEWIRSVTAKLSEEAAEPILPLRYSFDEGGAQPALMACQSLSLFATRNLVVLTQVFPAGSGKTTGAGKATSGSGKAATRAKLETESLEVYLESPIPNNVLIVCVPADKFDERKKLTKRLKSFPVIDCSVPKEPVGRATVQALAGDWGIDIHPDALAELWRRCKSISQSASELHKLWTYTDGQQIDVTAVDELVAPPIDDNVFDWIDGVVTGDIRRSLRVLTDVQRAGYDAFALYGLIVRQLRLMWYARTLAETGHSPQQIAMEAGAHPYAVRVAMKQARTVRTTDLEALLTVVADAEYAVKSGTRDAAKALEWVVASCAMKLRQVKSRRTS